VELDSISAIFPEMVRHGSHSASLDIPVSLIQPVSVLFPPTAVKVAPPPASLFETLSTFQPAIASVKAADGETRHLWNLPPLTVEITLRHGYPADVPPDVKLGSQSSWIPASKLAELERGAREMWEEFGHDQVFFAYIDSLQQAAEDAFGLAATGGTLEIAPELKVALLDFDIKTKQAKFDRETFDCGVCLEPRKGAVCHKMNRCGHVFCVECLQDFYNNCITEGDVASVKCLDPTCGKRDKSDPDKKPKRGRTLQPSELQQIPLNESIVQRYVKMKRKKKLEANRNTVYCPRSWCQGPARRAGDPLSANEDSDNDADDSPSKPETVPKTFDLNDEDAKLPPLAERLAVCEDCSFAFCVVCKSGWHGEFARCFPRSTYELTKEERATEAYLKKHSTPCPTCDARCQKTMGCNHMICFQCNSHFCYLCSSWLDSGNPYRHFNTAGAPCFQRLWEMEAGDGEGQDGRQVREKDATISVAAEFPA